MEHAPTPAPAPTPVRTRSADTRSAPRTAQKVADELAHLAPASRAEAWRRRGGALLVLASVVVLAVLAVLPGGGVADAVPVATETVVVEPGQTLWDVASLTAPEGVGTAAYVSMISEANGLADGSVDAWQVLLLPAG